MDNVIKSYGFFTTRRDFAEKKIEDYIRSHNCRCSKLIKRDCEIKAIMEDGTIYQWIPPSTNARGFRLSVVVIDLATCSINDITERILVFLLRNEKSIVLVDSEQPKLYEKGYDLHTLIDRLTKIEVIYGNIENVMINDYEFGCSQLSDISYDLDRKQLIIDSYC